MQSTTSEIKNKKPTVVAMSGGVDSSVAAALIKKENDNVIGVTLRLYDEKKISKSKSCCSGADIIDAKKIASDMLRASYTTAGHALLAVAYQDHPLFSSPLRALTRETDSLHVLFRD